MPRAKQERPPDPDRLVRRSAGDLHTEDGRFEVSSTGGAGRWYVTDTERHDGLGLALVLGPFGTLDEVRAAIAEQRVAPAGDDGPLPGPMAGEAATREDADRPRRGTAPRGRRRPPPKPEPGPPHEPEPGPPHEPEPGPPPRPPVRVTHARWRSRHDERDAVVDVIRRINEAWSAGEPEGVRDELHDGMVAQPAGSAVEGRAAVLDAWRSSARETPLITWEERAMEVQVAGATAVVTYRFELERDAQDEDARHQRGRELWVLTRTDGRWLAVFRMTLRGDPEDA
jgi:ketosteroid isomerase-like protein